MARSRDPNRLSELEELFADLWQVPRLAGLRRSHRPPVDVCRSGDEITIVVELAGADPQTIDVTLDGRRLVVAGDRPRARGKNEVWYRSEIEYGPFEREVTLAVDVSVDRASASYERGLLRIVLPVAERTQPARTRVPIEIRRLR